VPEPDLIIADPGVDGAASAALVARSRGCDYSVHFFCSEEFPGFFRRDYQADLPRFYNIFVCGLRVVRKDWQTRPVRSRLMEALRGLEQPMTWFSTMRWESDDRAAVGHLIGEENLIVAPEYRTTASLVAEHMPVSDDARNRELVSLPADTDTDALEGWGRVLSAHRDDYEVLSRAVTVLVNGHEAEVPGKLMQNTERVEKQNSTIAGEEHEVSRMGEVRVAFVELPPRKTAFWNEIGTGAMDSADAGLCIIHPDATDVVLFMRAPTRRLDLETWLRYLTDCLPGSEVLDGGPHWLPVHVPELGSDPTMKRQMLDILRGGAHLLTAS